MINTSFVWIWLRLAPWRRTTVTPRNKDFLSSCCWRPRLGIYGPPGGAFWEDTVGVGLVQQKRVQSDRQCFSCSGSESDWQSVFDKKEARSRFWIRITKSGSGSSFSLQSGSGSCCSSCSWMLTLIRIRIRTLAGQSSSVLQKYYV